MRYWTVAEEVRDREDAKTERSRLLGARLRESEAEEYAESVVNTSFPALLLSGESNNTKESRFTGLPRLVVATPSPGRSRFEIESGRLMPRDRAPAWKPDPIWCYTVTVLARGPWNPHRQIRRSVNFVFTCSCVLWRPVVQQCHTLRIHKVSSKATSLHHDAHPLITNRRFQEATRSRSNLLSGVIHGGQCFRN